MKALEHGPLDSHARCQARTMLTSLYVTRAASRELSSMSAAWKKSGAEMECRQRVSRYVRNHLQDDLTLTLPKLHTYCAHPRLCDDKRYVRLDAYLQIMRTNRSTLSCRYRSYVEQGYLKIQEGHHSLRISKCGPLGREYIVLPLDL